MTTSTSTAPTRSTSTANSAATGIARCASPPDPHKIAKTPRIVPLLSRPPIPQCQYGEPTVLGAGRQAAAVATLMGIVNDNDDRGLRSLRTMGRRLILV